MKANQRETKNSNHMKKFAKNLPYIKGRSADITISNKKSVPSKITSNVNTTSHFIKFMNDALLPRLAQDGIINDKQQKLFTCNNVSKSFIKPNIESSTKQITQFAKCIQQNSVSHKFIIGRLPFNT